MVPPKLLLVGLSHHTAPIAIREKVSIGEDELDSTLKSLRSLPGVEEAMVVSTCNRLEVYAATHSDEEGASREIRSFLAERDPSVDAHLYVRSGRAAIRHLFRVCASLDSMVVGEPQILGQVKDGFHRAEEAGVVGTLVSRAARRAFHVAKKVRTETEVGKSAVSMSFAAVELAKKVLGELDGRRVLLVGAGKMSLLAARHLLSAGCDEVHVANRSLARAEELAGEVGGVAHPWEELPSLLVDADVVVCSTAAPRPVITREMVQTIRRKRRHRPIFFIDLAVPRDVDPTINEVENAYVFDVDDLDKVMEENRESRREEAFIAEGIVEKEAEAFFTATWSEAEPLLRRLRLQAEEIAKGEVARTLAKHGDDFTPEQRESVEALARAIVNKLLHRPTAKIREAGLADDGAFLQAAAQLFDIQRVEASVSRLEVEKKKAQEEPEDLPKLVQKSAPG